MTEDPQLKTLGIFWGKKSLYLVESTGMDAPITTSIPFSMKTDGSDFSPFSSEGSDLVSNLANAFRQYAIDPDNIYLSLPTKDIIFRSFVIPWMQQSEIADVVEFEASKYIPFSLEELSYSFHSMNITEGNTKRIRIIFAAIKKTTLDTFTGLLEQANISINNVEPAPVSLIRYLSAKKFIPSDKTLAIIEKDALIGKITIVDQGIPLFVREFQLHSTSKENATTVPDPQAVLNRLMNEIRISLDYFSRQESHLKVEDLILLCDEDETDEIKNKLEIDIQIPTMPINIKATLNTSGIPSIDYLCAYGASYHDNIANHSNFDLIENYAHPTTTIQFDIKNIDFKSINYKPIVITAIICVCLITSFQALKIFLLKKANNRIAQLEIKLGKDQNKTAEMIQNKTKTMKEKLARYKSIRTSGDIAKLLTEIPNALPENAWLADLNCAYIDEKPEQTEKNQEIIYPINVSLNGYVYTENVTQHIGIITEFIRNLEKIDLISQFFQRIRVDSASQRKLGDYTVTYFKLDFVR